MKISVIFISYFFTFLFYSLSVYGQDMQRSMTATYITESIIIDGMMDEPAWQRAEPSENFWQFFPSDSRMAEYPTEVRFLFDDNYLYIGIRAEVPGDDYLVNTLRRDFGGANNDNITFMFDTYGDGSNAYLFGVTPYGVQRDVLISGGGGAGDGSMNTAWDTRWVSEATRYEDHYIVELAIPFNSIRFPDDSERWRFQAYRWDFQGNEQSAWNRVPQNQLLINLAFMGELIFDRPLGRSQTPMAFIPYITAGAERNFVTDEIDYVYNAGGDAKFSVGSGLNLDLTVNPDFSNVEADQFVTNLTRFEISLPEQRQFFLDNSDLFASFGNESGDASPFFSRRIGIARDNTGSLVENRILGGARLSGNLNEDWRVGILNLQTAENISSEIPGNNNMMVSLQRRVFSRSNVGAFFINRQTFGNYDFLNPEDRYNRVFGADFNLASSDNIWTGTFYLHSSIDSEDRSFSPSAQARVNYNTRNYGFTNDLTFIDRDFRSDLGFIPRTDFFRWGKRFIRTFWPESGFLNRHTFTLLLIDIFQPTLDYKWTDRNYSISWGAEFQDQSALTIRANHQYIFLMNDFDPTRSPGSIPLPGNTGYSFNRVSAEFTSNPLDLFTYSVESTIGQFFNGNSFSANGIMNLRIQPWATVGMSVRYDNIQLPDPHPEAEIWLLAPRFDITFSRSLFWSTLTQYSTQRDSFGINSRLQWRFAPLSDLFLVYNDNYIADSMSPQFRSLNLKVSYWF